MITYVEGDLFQSPAKVLVNPVNTVGVMGKGLALDFKRFYPDMFKKYQELCEREQFQMGQLWLYKTPHKWVLNFPTKRTWREKSKPEYIETGLQKFVETYEAKKISSVSFPMLGCGNGELDWESQVRPLMRHYLDQLPINIYIHLYRSKSALLPEHKNIQEIRAWLHGEPQALAFTEFWQDLKTIAETLPQLRTFGDNELFKLSLSPSGTGLLVEASGRDQIIINHDQLRDMWQYIRSAGYCMSQNFPSGLDLHSSFLVAILSQLDYLNPVVLSRADRSGYRQYGLQLIPAVLTPKDSNVGMRVVEPI